MIGPVPRMTNNRIAILRTMLETDGAVTATEIAERTGILHTTINESFKSLEDHGLVLADRTRRRQGLMRRFTLTDRRVIEQLLAGTDS